MLAGRRLHLLVGRGEQAHGPVRAEQQSLGSEDFEDVIDVRLEVVRRPCRPVGLRDDPRELARDVLELGELRSATPMARAPRWRSVASRCGRRRTGRPAAAARGGERRRELARRTRRSYAARPARPPGRLDHVVAEQPVGIRLVVGLVADADECSPPGLLQARPTRLRRGIGQIDPADDAATNPSARDREEVGGLLEARPGLDEDGRVVAGRAEQGCEVGRSERRRIAASSSVSHG